MSGPVLGTGHIVTNKSRHCCWNVASSGGRLTLVTRVQGLVFTGDWIFWSFSNWLTDVLLPWYWQCSLQGIWIILVCVKLIRFSVVSSLRAFSWNKYYQRYISLFIYKILSHAQPDLLYSTVLWYHISIIAILQMGELRPKGMVSLAQATQLEATHLMLQFSSH